MLSLPLLCQDLSLWMLLIFFSMSALIMKTSACFLVEVKKSFPQNANLISYLKETSPRLIWPTKAIYLLFLWSLLAFYLSALSKASAFYLPNFVLAQAFYATGLFSFLCLSSLTQGRFNKIFVFLMFAALISVLSLIGSPLNFTELSSQSSQLPSLKIFGILLTSFGFHHIVPSLSNYDDNLSHQKKAITFSIILIVFVYLLWVSSILSLTKAQGLRLESPLDFLSESKGDLKLKTLLITSFSFFASLTSSLGVSIGVYDFLKDTMNSYNTSASKSEKKQAPHYLLIFLTVLPSFFVSILTGESFLIILSFGSYLGLYLLVLLPCLIYYKLFQKKIALFVGSFATLMALVL